MELDQSLLDDGAASIADIKMQPGEISGDNEGVSLTTNQLPLPVHEPSPSINRELSATYCQISPANPNDLPTAWHLPVSPHKMRVRQIANTGAREYHKHCRLISKHWRCNHADFLPLSLREHTPYSFTMLARLRTLACLTKQDKDMAHSLLLNSRQHRLDQLHAGPDNPPMIFETSTESVRSSLSIPESTIIEHASGLILDDVRRAIQDAKEARFPKRKKFEGERMESANDEKTARKADLKQLRAKAKRERKKERAKLRKSITGQGSKNPTGVDVFACQMEGGDELVDVEIGYTTREGQAPLNRPDLFEEAFGSTDSARVELSSDGVQNGQQKEQQNQSSRYHSKQDRYEDSLMSRMLDHVEIDDWERRKARTKKLMQRGASGKSSQPNSMPLEKMDFNSLPTLPTVYPKTGLVDLERLGQLSLDATPD